MYMNRNGGSGIRLGSLGLAISSYGMIVAALISSIPGVFAFEWAESATILQTRNIPLVAYVPAVPLCKAVGPKTGATFAGTGIRSRSSVGITRSGVAHKSGRARTKRFDWPTPRSPALPSTVVQNDRPLTWSKC